MIFTLTIIGLMTMVQALLFIIPDIPSMPSAIVSAGDTILTQIIPVISFAAYILSPGIFFGAIVIFAALFAFETVYYSTMWILKKIPMVNIK